MRRNRGKAMRIDAGISLGFSPEVKRLLYEFPKWK